MRKSVGVITMHRPLSYGSALQSYATIKAIHKLGYNAEIIDYKYPNDFHILSKKPSVIYTILFFIQNLILGFPNKKKNNKFKKFYNRFYKTSRFYSSYEDLMNNPPLYDIYVTGSDQVWNTNFTKGDMAFLLGFAPQSAVKISYSASFAHSQLDQSYHEIFKKQLLKYQYITVREESGVDIINNLIGKSALHVCDPTVLLSREEWNEIADTSTVNVKKKYLLVFMLCYSFNPYPQARSIIHKLSNELNLDVIYLDGIKSDYFEKRSKVIKCAGPMDFIHLIRNADYVITDSFHGTVFSALYNKPFSSIVKNDNSDSRVKSFLKRIGAEEYALAYNSSTVTVNKPLINSDINDFREKSLNILREGLSYR